MLLRRGDIAFTDVAPAMHVFLERLETHLAKQPFPDFMERFRAVIPLYPVWNAKED